MPTKIDDLIRFEQLDAICGIRSRATLARLQKTREFPLPMKLGGNAAFWRVADIRKWVGLRNIGQPVRLDEGRR